MILDANILLSYLLAPSDPESVPSRIVAAAALGKFTLIALDEVFAEVRDVAARKDYFRRRVDLSDLTSFIDDLILVGEHRSLASAKMRPITRDPHDDYLVAAALLFRVDLLVSGDRDLLDLRQQFAEFTIASPREFLDLIET